MFPDCYRGVELCRASSPLALRLFVCLGLWLKFVQTALSHSYLAVYINHELFMKFLRIFDKEWPPPNTARNFISPKGGHFSATRARQFSCGHCQTHLGAVLEKKPPSDFPPGSIYPDWQLALRTPKIALLNSPTGRTPLSSSRDAGEFPAFRLNDVVQPPGGRKKCYKWRAKHYFCQPAILNKKNHFSGILP